MSHVFFNMLSIGDWNSNFLFLFVTSFGTNLKIHLNEKERFEILVMVGYGVSLF